MTESVAVESGPTGDRYKPTEIESKWQRRWREDGIYRVDLDDTKEKFYFLTMYPYPSGDLHVGHWYAEVPADASARFLRMRGYNVLFPMGFDAFGLPAENAAIRAARTGEDVHPASLTYQRIARMEEQFSQMGAMFDWSKKIVTCDPQYYRWNQWLFLKLYERGLAYRKESYVNWDPVDQTVLANEQVVDGRGDRSGALIERRLMPQWHFKITAYADELLDFSGVEWPDRVRLMQTNWIGRSEGADVTFAVEASDDEIAVFTTRPDTLWGATFMVLAPEHPLVAKLTTEDRRPSVEAYVERAGHLSELDRQTETREKSGEFTGAYAINPVNGARIPIWIADYVLMGYGTGAIMAVPAGDQRDYEFATAFGLDIVPVVLPDGADEAALGASGEAWSGPGTLFNSGPLDGLRNNGEKGRANPAIAAALDHLESLGAGREQVTYRLRDWLISRQRYWGTPIPVLYCDRCGIVPEREENLPVELPGDVAFMPTGESPLKSHAAFLEATCPVCAGAAKRETDTMDTFVDSAWYWFRYLSPDDDSQPFDRAMAEKWTPVDIYTGGIEHAILHLLYARFFTKALRDMGLVNNDEPFKRLRNQGIILGEDNEKMSKSRGNVVNPDPLVAEYGADTVRAYLMFIGPWDQGGPWNYQGIEGLARFMQRVWTLVTGADTQAPTQADPRGAPSESDDTKAAEPLRRAVNHAIKEVTEDFEGFRFNTAVAELMTLLNAMYKFRSQRASFPQTWSDSVRAFLLLLAPIAPHISEELWHRSGFDGSVHLQTWPQHDPSALVAATVRLAVQVNGKVRGQIEAPNEADEATLLAMARAEENVARHLAGATIKREIVVPGRLISFVTG